MSKSKLVTGGVFRNFTYEMRQAFDGTYSVACQWDSGSGWYFQRDGFSTIQNAKIYILGKIIEETNRAPEQYRTEGA